MQTAQILIKDLKFYAYHGVYPHEQEVGTSFKADVILDLDPTTGFASDRLADTLNYEILVQRILSIATQQKFRLIERLAQVLCEEMLKFDPIQAADITIYKSVKQLTPEPQWIGVRCKISKND